MDKYPLVGKGLAVGIILWNLTS